MAAYSKTDKFLHWAYLSNYRLAKATLEMESIIFGPSLKTREVNQCVFVTGLARSGTTAFMRQLHDTGHYASLQYSNMPFLLAPNLWKRRSEIEPHERAHKDGIIVDGNSPEEFDEFFWKSHLKDSYITNEGLVLHNLSNALLFKYQQFVQLICYAKGKSRYLTKNNNNILRLQSLQRIPSSHIFVLFREPFSHASSLLKLHKKFTDKQRLDQFTLDYFNYLGHHEFGLNHKPFLLSQRSFTYEINDINYWLSIWLNYYQYILDVRDIEFTLICFEELICAPEKVYHNLGKILSTNILPITPTRHIPTKYKYSDCDKELLKKCIAVYNKLLSKT